MLEMLRLAPYGAREITFSTLAFAVCACIFGYLGGVWFLVLVPFALVWGWSLSFFRNPVRTIPQNPNAILSPADGTVTHIIEVQENEFMGGPCLMIGIFLSVFNVHLNRAPFAGTVAHVRYTPGKFHDARTETCSKENERNDIGFTTADSRLPRVMIRQISGAIARRIVCDTAIGRTHQAGAILGMIKFGSRTEIYLPLSSPFRASVQVGDAVRAGETILGELA